MNTAQRSAVALVALLVLVGPARGQLARTSIDKLFSPYKKARYALCVRDLQTDRELVAIAADRPQKPASVQKLFITAAALHRFGPDFAFRTRVYLDGPDLLIVGGGDPGLGDERLAEKAGRAHLAEFDAWAEALDARGVSQLRHIALDDTVFEQAFRHPDWPANQAANWYQAPVGGLNLNDNCLDVRVVAGGGKVRAETTPRVGELILKTSLVAAEKHRPIATRAIGQDVIEVRGPVSKSAGLGSVAVGVPSLYVGAAVKAELEARGVAVTAGLVRRPRGAAGDPVLLATHATSLPDVLWRTNTFSQNMFAEALLKSLAAYRGDGQRSGTAGSWEAGRAVLRQELGALGVPCPTAVFRDGSGLSHDNRATARQITALLARMWRHPHRAVFQASLARPGERGTMERRYRDPRLKGRVWGKTGTISGVRSLAGYVQTADGTYAFALLIDGSVPADLPAKVCVALVEGLE